LNFTETNVKKLAPPADKGDVVIWDDAMPGFGIRFRAGGAGAYFIRYSVHGRQSKATLGKVDQVSLAFAKNEAKQLFAMVARGVDPAVERIKAKATAASTFGAQIEPFIAYLTEEGRVETYVNDNRRSLERRFKALHTLGIKTIERAMIAVELGRIKKVNGPRAAGNCRAHASKFFNWLIAEGLADINPVEGTTKNASKRRSRVLTPDELVHVWNESGDGDYGTIIKLLMLTGTRLDTIGGLRRSEINFKEGYLDLPATRNKNGERFLVALSRRAEAILRSVPEREGSDFVFGRGDGGFSGWYQSKSRLDGRLVGKVENWVHHDFRRTFNTLGVKAGISALVADVCLHHVGEHKKGIKRTYNHADYIDEKRDAMNKWADYIDGLLNKQPKLSVVA
jgi:integrase